MHALFDGRYTQCLLEFKKKITWEAKSQYQTQFIFF